MSTIVDERIVAAKFDSSDFEKGVDKTIKKLDELKKTLEMQDSSKSVEKLAEKAETSTDSMSKSLDKLTNRLTTFTGMIKQQILSGLAEEVSGVFIKMERAVTGFVRSISTDQIGAGLDKYQQILTSVRVMTADPDISQSRAYEAIGELRNYVDQTSYSLTQMSDALSKMTAAGVRVEDATKSVIGIANACASAGINAQDAQRAFYNLAQAYGKGKLEFSDYRSLELLNMTTKQFKTQLLEASAAAGKLKKLDEETYKIVTGKGRGKKVTRQNLTDMMKYGFITNDVMNEVFGKNYYFGEKEVNQIKKDLGINKYDSMTEAQQEKVYKEARKRYSDIAVDSYLAAREARNFTDVVNTFKDYISTGWSKSFEYLFGQLEQAKDFFTSLTEGKFAGALYSVIDYINKLLSLFNGRNAEGELHGAKMFTETIYNISEAIGTVLQTILSVLPGYDKLEDEDDEFWAALSEDFENAAVHMRDASLKVAESAENFNKFMNSPAFNDKEGPTRIELLRQAFANLFGIFTIGKKVIQTAFASIGKVIVAFQPIFDGLLVALTKITQPIDDLAKNDDPFKKITYGVDNLLVVIKPLIDGLSSILPFLGEIGGFLVSFAIDTVVYDIQLISDALGFLLEILGVDSAQMKDKAGIIDNLKTQFKGFADVCRNGLDFIKEFFSLLLDDLRELFGLTAKTEGAEKGGAFSRLAKFFDSNEFIKSVREWIDTAIENVGNFIKDIPNKIKAFGASIYDTIWHAIFIGEEKEIDEKNGQLTGKTKMILTPFGKWLENAIKDIKEFIISIPDKIIQGIGKVTSWVDEIFNYWFGENTPQTTEGEAKDETNKQTEKVKSNFDTFINSTITSIKEWFADLPNKIRSGLKSVGGFIGRLFNTIDSFLFGKKKTTLVWSQGSNGERQLKKTTVRYKTGFSKWLDGVIAEVKKFIKNIPEYIKTGIKSAGDIVTTIVNAIFGRDETTNQENTSQKIEEQIKAPFLGINWDNIWATIKDIGLTLFNQLARIFTNSEDLESNIKWFTNDILTPAIKWISTEAKKAFDLVLREFPKIPQKIAAIFNGKEKSGSGEEQGAEPVRTAVDDFIASVGSFIKGIPSALTTFVTNAIKTLGNIWDNFYYAIIYGADEATDPKILQSKVKDFASNTTDKVFGTDFHRRQKTEWDLFVEDLGTMIGTAFEELPKWIGQGIHLAILGLQSAFDGITNWINDANLASQAEELAKEATESVEKGAEEGTKTEEAKESPLVTAIKDIAASIWKLLTTNIPNAITAAWTWISNNGGGLIKGIENIFTGNPETAFEQSVIEFGEKIWNTITTVIPAKVKTGFDYVAKLLSGTAEVKEPELIQTKGRNTNSFEALETADMGNGLASIYDKHLVKYDAKLKKETEKKSNWTFVDSIGESIKSAFGNIGPTILNALGDAISWVGKIGMIIVSALTGEESITDQIMSAYGEEKPELRAALVKIGEAIKDFFLDTVPQFIGSAIGTLAANAGEWFSKLFDALDKAKEKVEKDRDQAAAEGEDVLEPGEAAENIFQTISKWMNSFSGILTTDFVGAIGILFAMTALLKAVKNLFSFADDMDAVSRTFKWAAITIAIAGITAMLGTITNLVSSDDPSKVQSAMDFLDKLSQLFEKVVWIVGLITIGKAADMLGEFAARGKAPKIGNGLMEGVTGFFNNILKLGGAGVGSYLAGGLFGAGIESFISTVSDTITDLAGDVSDIVEMLTPFIDDLNNMNTKVDTAIDTVNKLKNLFETFWNVFTGLYSDVTGFAIQKLYEDDSENSNDYYAATDEYGRIISLETKKEIADAKAYMTSLQQRVDVFLQLATFIDTMSGSLEKFGNVSDVEGKMDEMISTFTSSKFEGFLTKLLNTLHKAVLASDIDPTKYNNTLYMSMRTSGITVALEAMSSAFSTFNSGIQGLDDNALTVLDHSFDIFAKMGDMFDNKLHQSSLSKAFLGNSSISKVATEIKRFGFQIKSFYQYINEIDDSLFSEERYDATRKKIHSIVEIAQDFALIIKDMLGYGSSTELVSQLGDALPNFGNAVGQFIQSIERVLTEGDKKISVDRSQIVLNYVESFSDLMQGIDAVRMWNLSNNAEDINKTLLNIAKAFMDPQVENALAASIYAIHKGISGALNKSLGDPQYTDVWSGVGTSMAILICDSIQAALDNPDNGIRPTIIPVLETGVMDQQLDQYFANKVAGLSASGLTDALRVSMKDADNINKNEQVGLIAADVSAIKKSLSNLASPGDITSALGGMRMVLSTGQLVGYLTPAIDAKIGERIILLKRNNTVE